MSPESVQLARAWLAKARSDLDAARVLSGHEERGRIENFGEGDRFGAEVAYYDPHVPVVGPTPRTLAMAGGSFHCLDTKGRREF